MPGAPSSVLVRQVLTTSTLQGDCNNHRLAGISMARLYEDSYLCPSLEATPVAHADVQCIKSPVPLSFHIRSSCNR